MESVSGAIVVGHSGRSGFVNIYGSASFCAQEAAKRVVGKRAAEKTLAEVVSFGRGFHGSMRVELIAYQDKSEVRVHTLYHEDWQFDVCFTIGPKGGLVYNVGTKSFTSWIDAKAAMSLL